MNRWIIALAALLASHRCFAEEQIVARILASLDDHQQSLNSVDVHYEIKGSPNWEFSHMDQQPGYHCRWARSGRKQLLTQDSTTTPGTARFNRIWASFDGEQGYSVYYHDQEQTIVKRIDITPSEPVPLVANQHIAGILGWRPLHQHVPETLISLLRKRKDQAISAEETIHDDPCWKISLGNVGAFVKGGPEHEVVAWFSRRFDLMPRRIAVLPLVANTGNSTTVSLTQGSFPCFTDVLDFRQVDDPLFKKSRWFPTRVQSRDVFSNEVSVKEVSINTPIPSGTFEPEMSTGTEMLTISSGSTSPKVSYIGGQAGEQLYQQRLQQFGRPKSGQPPKQANTVDASPRIGTGFSRMLLLAFSAALIIAAVVVAKRQDRG
ncbi:MAG: hypothetical protein U0941_27840 [Planctomycetaceae bacterium]